MKLLPKAIKGMSSLITPLTNCHFKTRRFLRRFHLPISPHRRSTRLNCPIGPLRRQSILSHSTITPIGISKTRQKIPLLTQIFSPRHAISPTFSRDRHETLDLPFPLGIFKPEDPNQSPEDLFQPLPSTLESPSSPLYHVNDFTKTLIYIDGTSINNGSPDAKAGCGVYRSPNELLNICRPLPVGTTNSRAELWAAVCALELIVREPIAADAVTSPTGVGGAAVDSWIIASDSSYVVIGATNWAWKWRAVGWKKNASKAGRKKKNASKAGRRRKDASKVGWKKNASKAGRKKENTSKVGGIGLSEGSMLGEGFVPNADLWNRLLRGIMDVQGGVLFWLIPRKWNRADGLAKRGAVRIFTIYLRLSIIVGTN
ncbi:unnamed protein product [Tuber melanosporum]|uniref:ribonuclease H n=1 Tax=Tuber melanosporum (strain Mel28) TaxID=656061 RepID=D5GPK3_TUBMM|nr:uncharacterized protein GSTUM_00011883001 [Tuber melanosporum]CAZ86446.1 unnamed protein product [Tuber melanosporum]